MAATAMDSVSNLIQRASVFTMAETDAVMALRNVGNNNEQREETLAAEMVTEQLLKLNSSPRIKVPSNQSATDSLSSPPQSSTGQSSQGSPPSSFSAPERILDKSKVKYDILDSGVAYPRQCGDCDALHTSGHWCLDTTVHNGHICQKCYRRRRRALDAGRKYKYRNRDCKDCQGQTDGKWFKHGSIVGAYLCKNCHSKKNIKLQCDTCGGHDQVESRRGGTNACKWCNSVLNGKTTSSSLGQLSPVSMTSSKHQVLPPLHLLAGQYCKPKQELRGNPYLPPIHLYLAKYAI